LQGERKDYAPLLFLPLNLRRNSSGGKRVKGVSPCTKNYFYRIIKLFPSFRREERGIYEKGEKTRDYSEIRPFFYRYRFSGGAGSPIDLSD
jgi:hypothetical protein